MAIDQRNTKLICWDKWTKSGNNHFGVGLKTTEATKGKKIKEKL